MIKIFHTADVHIGKKYDRYPDIREKLIESRFECLKRAVRKADEESCDFFVIAGDLFDRVNGIAVNDVKKVVGILADFGGTVIVMPGNHDYYNEEVKVWRDFKDVLAKTASNIVLMAEMKEYSFTANGECVYFYPALCQSKHSEENGLGWIKERTMDERAYHIGIAHGSVDKYSPDFNKEYYPMTEKELTNIPVDAWLLGHTHVPFPNDLREDKDTEGYALFNPGTIEQTDFSNNTEGFCFRVECSTGGSTPSIGCQTYFRIVNVLTDLADDVRFCCYRQFCFNRQIFAVKTKNIIHETGVDIRSCAVAFRVEALSVSDGAQEIVHIEVPELLL